MIRSANKNVLANRILYNLGRTTTYIILGLIIGVFGKALNFAGVQKWLSILAGGLLILAVTLPRSTTFFSPLVSRLVQPLKKIFAGFLGSTSLTSAYLVGVFNGLLPCGMIYAALLVALTQTTILDSTLVMGLFGLGTIPALLAFAYSAQLFSGALTFNFKKIEKVLLLSVALLLIWRGIAVVDTASNTDEVETYCTGK